MHTIVVTVGISIIDKTWKSRPVYETLMGSEDGINRGLLADCGTQKILEGDGWKKRYGVDGQLEMEAECFTRSKRLQDIGQAIRLRKQNPYSAEVSSLYGIFNDKRLDPNTCRVVLLTTDSPEGIFAARLNKRIIAYRLFNCDERAVHHWRTEADNCLALALERIPILQVPGLQVTDAKKFKEAGSVALERAILDQQSSLQPGDLRILNVTGGFKGVIPVMVAIAWRYGWQVLYLYEETDRYLIIDRPEWIEIQELGSGTPTIPIQHPPI